MNIALIGKHRPAQFLGLVAGIACLLASGPVPGGEKEEAAAKPRSIVLTTRRTYNLEVQRLDPLMDVTLAKQWVFAKGFPTDLLAAIKNSRLLKSPAPAALRDEDSAPSDKKRAKIDSGYIRWQPENKKSRQAPSALLWFVNGTKRKELVISVSQSLDPAAVKKAAHPRHTFGPLRLTVDLENAHMTDLSWGDLKFPAADDKAAAAEVEDTVMVGVMGSLSEGSRASIRAADRLLSDEVSQKLSRLGYAALSNESHHGISLGWLGHEHLRHELMLVVGPKAVDFRYRVSGTAFPLRLMRQQLHDSGWPLVLHGHEYLGSSDDGTHVLQPIEYVLTKRQAKKPKSNKPKK